MSGPYKVAYVLPVPEDFARNEVSFRMEDIWDIGRRPWLYQDRNPMPSFDWWPWLDRSKAGALEAKARMLAAADVIRNGKDPDHECW